MQRQYRTIERNMYVSGSAARNIETSPRKRQVEVPERRQQRKTKVKTRPSVSLAGIMYVFCISFAAVMIVGLSILFLTQQSANKTNVKEIASLEKQISKLKTQNDILETEIYSNVDYDVIYDRAVLLGMTNTDEKQIVKYDRGTLEYVKQYKDVPTE